jgi:hypothetical protein
MRLTFAIADVEHRSVAGLLKRMRVVQVGRRLACLGTTHDAATGHLVRIVAIAWQIVLLLPRCGLEFESITGCILASHNATFSAAPAAAG